MADGEYLVKLGDTARRRLKERAASAGLSEEAFAAFLLEQQLFNYDDYAWPDGDPRTEPPPPFDADEPTYSHDEVMAGFREELEKRLAAKP